MPPRKRAARNARRDSTTSGDAVEQPAEDASTPVESESARDHVAVSDPWTDQQETSLFKGMIKWKPVGSSSRGGRRMHKHFRMIAISENLKAHGCNGYESPDLAHTRIPGIWNKLGSLYNLEALDIREDVMGDVFYPFSLPDEEYGDRILASRIEPDGSSTPPSLPHLLAGPSINERRVTRRHSTVDDTDDPRSSPASAYGHKPGRSTRASKGTRLSQLAEVSNVGGRGSKASLDQGTEDDQRAEEDDDDAMDEDEDNSKAETPIQSWNKFMKSGAYKNTTRRSGRKR